MLTSDLKSKTKEEIQEMIKQLDKDYDVVQQSMERQMKERCLLPDDLVVKQYEEDLSNISEYQARLESYYNRVYGSLNDTDK